MMTNADPATIPAEEEKAEMDFDVAIIGGGLAGLSLAIQLSRENFSVVLFEKEAYPFHRVCGEYISFECWNFLESIGYPLSDMDLPVIKELLVSAPNGNTITHRLPLGGFGISRYKIDLGLAVLARESGTVLRENDKVTAVSFRDEIFTVRSSTMCVRARMVASAYGKRSNLDVALKRKFMTTAQPRLSNFIGVKYHIQTNAPADRIALHNFRDGYCGLSRIEDNRYCLCYLTTAANLGRAGNSIREMEKTILGKNPLLRQILEQSVFIRPDPVTIAQVSFSAKEQVEDHMLMVGDAAGMITPLCGNGMSMALHASKLAATEMKQFLHGRTSRSEMELAYTRSWKNNFAARLATGRFIQRLFGRPWVTNLFIGILKPFPKFVAYLIRKTHGEPF